MKSLAKVDHVAMLVEEAVDVIRQLYVFVRENYVPPPDHEIAQMTPAVPWLTVCLVVIDSVEPSDGNRLMEIEWIASRVWLWMEAEQKQAQERMKESRRVAVGQHLYYAMNAKIVFHSYSDVAWTAGETVSPRKNATETVVTIHGRVASEWETQAQAVVAMWFVLAPAEMHKDSVGSLYYYLGEHPVAEAVTNLSPVAEDEELSEWVQIAVGLYAHGVVAAMIAPAEYSNQSAEPHLVAR